MKIKSIIACTLLSLTIVFSATGQTPTRPRSNQPQWEYLVVSFGKVYFSDPMTDPEAKSSGLSKLLSFSQAGIVIAKEGLSTQKSMDTLGKFGWELVGAVGVIGGDQEMLFKRAYDEGRSKQEEELIRQEGEKLRKILEDERTKSSLAVPATELVDLDEAERIEARNANRRAQEERFKTSTASVIFRVRSKQNRCCLIRHQRLTLTFRQISLLTVQHNFSPVETNTDLVKQRGWANRRSRQL
ncbi:MAG: hypothetical protein IPK98_02525 [Chloracidobacterium sp.]|nr:hypothetical protein [Chloracidobacterium sp.]